MPEEGLGLTIFLHNFFKRSSFIVALSNLVLILPFCDKLIVNFDFADVVDLLPIFVESVKNVSVVGCEESEHRV